MISLKRGGVTISQFGQQIAYLFFLYLFFYIHKVNVYWIANARM